MKKKYYIVSGTLFVILLMFVSIREYKGNYYEMSVEDAQAVLNNTDPNISAEELKATGSEILQIEIVTGGTEKEVFSEVNNLITIPASNLLNRKFLKRLKNHKGTIAIVSENVDQATHAWLILTRKGIDNVKILGIANNEMLRYTFEPEKDQL